MLLVMLSMDISPVEVYSLCELLFAAIYAAMDFVSLWGAPGLLLFWQQTLWNFISITIRSLNCCLGRLCFVSYNNKSVIILNIAVPL